MITLYGDSHWDSPYFFTAFVALREKGLEFETKTLDLDKGEQREPSFAGAITGRIPAIEHDGFWLAESTAIVEYVDSFGSTPSLLPREERRRARARQVMSWLRSDLLALREERPTTTMFFERAKQPLTAKGQDAADKLLRATSMLLDDATFRDWSIAHVDLAFMLHRLLLNGHEVPANVRAFAEREWARQSVRAFVEHERAPI
jgi:glutathione S-transferase